MPFYQITWTNLDVISPHLVAYLNSFDPVRVFVNYWGDAGFTAVARGSQSFQVVVPTGGTLLLVFQDNPATADHVDARYTFTVNAFSDAEGAESFASFAATPLPAALSLFATGIGVLGLFGWRRKKKDAALAA